MPDYRKGAHTVYDIQYHFVWVTKYRYQVLRGETAERAREIIRQICVSREMTILKGHISSDHVHLMVSCPPASVLPKSPNISKAFRRVNCKMSFRYSKSATGGNICGHAAISAARLALLPKNKLKPILTII